MLLDYGARADPAKIAGSRIDFASRAYVLVVIVAKTARTAPHRSRLPRRHLVLPATGAVRAVAFASPATSTSSSGRGP